MRKVLILLTILCTWAAVVCAQGKYSIASGEAPKAGSKITSVPFITLTYGAEGGKDFIAAGEGFSEFTPGNGINPTPTSLPTTGTFYKFDVYKDGTLQVGVVLEANKKFFVLEDGVPMTDYNGITVSNLYFGLYSIPVKKYKTYHVYSTNSCLGFFGFLFDYGKNTPLSAYDLNQPLGWGEDVTGGEDQNKVTVTNGDALKNALKGTDPKTIYIKGTIEISSPIKVKGGANKTVYGIDNATIYNDQRNMDAGGLLLSECNNIIIRNVTFKGEGAFDIDGNDNFSLAGCKNVWIDHCTFVDGVDGNFDCTKGSDSICVSWCRFRYTKPSQIEGMTGDGSGEHRYSNLWGGNDFEAISEGKLNTTFVSCWWDNGVVERMPRIRDGKVHIVNCYYGSDVTNYCIGVGTYAQILVENSVFNGRGNNYENKSYAEYSIKFKGCIGQDDYEEADGKPFFTPDYWLPPYSVDDVVYAVRARTCGAGATLIIEENGLPIPTAIQEVNAVQQRPAVFDVYTLSGVKVRNRATSLDGLPHGIYIVSGRKIAVR
jgi:pectate lyase